MRTTLIERNIFTDQRGSVSYVNDFKFLGIERFYIIENSETHPLRVGKGTSLILKIFIALQVPFKFHL